jgi:hypothetical protein
MTETIKTDEIDDAFAGLFKEIKETLVAAKEICEEQVRIAEEDLRRIDKNKPKAST